MSPPGCLNVGNSNRRDGESLCVCRIEPNASFAAGSVHVNEVDNYEPIFPVETSGNEFFNSHAFFGSIIPTPQESALLEQFRVEVSVRNDSRPFGPIPALAPDTDPFPDEGLVPWECRTRRA